MKCRSKTVKTKAGFSLIETLAALVILTMVSGSVLSVIDRCMAAATDSAMKMKALEVARENMEKLVAMDAISETVSYGISDKYPEIKWQTTVETFFDTVTSRMWLKGICSAEYEDSKGQMQTLDLTCWLSELSKKELMMVVEQKAKEMAQLPTESGFDSDVPDFGQNEGPDNTENDKNKDNQKEDDKQSDETEPDEQPDEPEQKPKPLPGLPDGWEEWSFGQAFQWLKDNGYW